MINDLKWVTAAKLRPGDEVSQYKQGNSVHMARWTVIEANPTYVQWRCFDRDEETIAAEGCLFGIKMTRDEYKAKWRDKAKIALDHITTQIESMNWDSHTMDNGWCDIDAYRLAQICEDRGFVPLGWFPLNEDSYHICYTGETLDIGVAATDGEDTFWCHYKKEWLDEMKSWFEHDLP